MCFVMVNAAKPLQVLLYVRAATRTERAVMGVDPDSIAEITRLAQMLHPKFSQGG